MLFEKLPSAIHFRAYSLENIEELRHLTELADYYRCLPVVSFTVGQVVLESKKLCADIRNNPLDILGISLTLRNRELFQDAATWTARCWDEPKHSQIEDIRIRSAAQHTRRALAEAIISLDMNFFIALKRLERALRGKWGGDKQPIITYELSTSI